MKPISAHLDIYRRRLMTSVLAAVVGAGIPPAKSAAEVPSAALAGSSSAGSVVLDNERVTVRLFAIEPDQVTGSLSHQDPRLRVFIKGGILKSESNGRSTLWRDGRVVWLDARQPADEASRNVGQTTIMFEEVTLKPYRRPPSVVPPAVGYLNYPNIAMEDVLENDHVIVQRFSMNPGQWEGIHGHNANTLYIFIKGGTGGHWKSRTTNPPSEVTGFSPDGDVGWMPAIDISAGHESSNTGTSPSDVVWIALKN